MRPGGGGRRNYAHSTNMTKLTPNSHIQYNFENEDENSLFVPDLPTSLREEVRALKRKRRRSDSANDQATEDDCEAMFAPMSEQEESATVNDEEIIVRSAPKQGAEDQAPGSLETADATPDPKSRKVAKTSVSDNVAARLAAIRSSRTPQPRREGTPTTASCSTRAATHVRASSFGSASGSPINDTGSPGASIVELKRAELARIKAAKVAVNEKNEAMLQAMDAARAKKAHAEARELRDLEREIAAEKEKLAIARGHAEEIRAHALDIDAEQGGMGEAIVKLEYEE